MLSDYSFFPDDPLIIPCTNPHTGSVACSFCNVDSGAGAENGTFLANVILLEAGVDGLSLLLISAE